MPKYLPRSWTIGMFVNEEMLCSVSKGVFREKNSLDLAALQIWPDTSQRLKNRLKRVVHSWRFALVNRKISSTNKIWLNPIGQRPTQIGESRLVWSVWSNDNDKWFRQRMKRYGDNGSPCLMPWDGRKGALTYPFHKIETKEDAIQAIINSIIGVGKW